MGKESLMSGVEPENQEIDNESEQVESSNEDEGLKLTNRRPEELDDKYWDEEKGSVKMDELLNDYKTEQKKALDLRKILSQKGSTKPPKDVAEYQYSEDVLSLIPEGSDTANLLKEVALDSGLSKDQFSSFVSRLIPSLQERGLLKFDEQLTEEQLEAQHNEYKEAELKKLGNDGKRVLQTVVNWGEGMVNSGVLSRDELPVFQDMATSAESLVVLSKIASLTGEPSIPVKTAVIDGLPSQKEIEEIIASDSYKNGDSAAHKKVEHYFKSIYGE